MDLRKRMMDLSLANKGLYYRLSIIFSLFFFVPLLGLLYFGLKYNLLEDKNLPVIVLVLLVSSLAGYVLIRKTFDTIRNISKMISDSLSREFAEIAHPAVADELQGIVQAFHALKSELQASIISREWRTSQLSTLKELSDLCYVTFDNDDLFAITLERALKLEQDRLLRLQGILDPLPGYHDRRVVLNLCVPPFGPLQEADEVHLRRRRGRCPDAEDDQRESDPTSHSFSFSQ